MSSCGCRCDVVLPEPVEGTYMNPLAGDKSYYVNVRPPFAKVVQAGFALHRRAPIFGARHGSLVVGRVGSGTRPTLTVVPGRRHPYYLLRVYRLKPIRNARRLRFLLGVRRRLLVVRTVEPARL